MTNDFDVEYGEAVYGEFVLRTPRTVFPRYSTLYYITDTRTDDNIATFGSR